MKSAMKIILLDEELRDGGGVNTVVESLVKVSKLEYINLNTAGRSGLSSSERIYNFEFDSFLYKLLPVFIRKIILYFSFVFKEKNSAILYVHQPKSLVWAGILNLFFNVRYVYHCHGIHGKWLNSSLKSSLFEFSLNKASKIIAVSNHVRGTLYEKFNTRVDIAVIYNGVKLPASHAMTKKKREIDFIFVGRICEEKGAVEFLDICEKHLKSKRCVIVGKYDNDDYEIHFKHKLSNTPSVSYLGVVSFPTVQSLLQNSSNFVCCSNWGEPFGLVVIEAMAAGCLVITRPDGGIKEIVDDSENGYFYENISDFKSILKKISDEETRTRIVNNASKRVEFFDSTKMVASIENIFTALVL